MQVPVVAWYLENRIGNHRKFYTVLIADNGVVVTNWGRIGTQGQGKIQKLNALQDAEAVGKRQVYAKQTGGYSVLTNEFKFTVDEETLNEACRRDMWGTLTRAFVEAQRDPQYQGEQEVVLKHYDDFVDKAQRLLATAGERSFEDVFAEFEELRGAWQALSDKHDEVAVTVSLVEQTLQQRLMAGAL